MAPAVSVLIPVWNCAAWLGAAIESVLAQSYSDYEILVADDGSEDDTAAVAAAYPQVRCLRLPHRGVSAARNAALAQARGRFIAFLDGDDLWAPEKLKRQMAYLSAHPDCQIVFTGAENFFGGGGPMTPRQQALLKDRLERPLPTACIRRELFETAGTFREDMTWGEDTEWFFRLDMAGVDLTHLLPEVLYRRRVHNDNLSLSHDPIATPRDLLPLLVKAIRSTKEGKKTP